MRFWIFGLTGRINRLTYLIQNVIFLPIMFITWIICIAVIREVTGFTPSVALALVFMALTAWPLVASYVRRGHDIGSDGWTLFFLIQLIFVGSGLYLLFKEGEQIHNQHGSMPTKLKVGGAENRRGFLSFRKLFKTSPPTDIVGALREHAKSPGKLLALPALKADEIKPGPDIQTESANEYWSRPLKPIEVFQWSAYEQTSLAWAASFGASSGLLYEFCQAYRFAHPEHKNHTRGNRKLAEDGGYFGAAKCAFCGTKNIVTKGQIKSPYNPAPDHLLCAEQAQANFEFFTDQLRSLVSGKDIKPEHIVKSIENLSETRITKKLSKVKPREELNTELLTFTFQIITNLCTNIRNGTNFNTDGLINAFKLFPFIARHYGWVETGVYPSNEILIQELYKASSSILRVQRNLIYDWLNLAEGKKEPVDDYLVAWIMKNYNNETPHFLMAPGELVVYDDWVEYLASVSKTTRDHQTTTETEGGEYSSNTVHWDWGVSNTQGELSPVNSTSKTKTVTGYHQEWDDAKKAQLTMTTRQLSFRTEDNIAAGVASFEKMGVLTPNRDGFHFQRTRSGSSTEGFVGDELAGRFASLLLHNGSEIERQLTDLLHRVDESGERNNPQTNDQRSSRKTTVDPKIKKPVNQDLMVDDVDEVPSHQISELTGGSDVEDLGLEGWDLHLAAEKGMADIARALVARGDEIDARNKYDATPLHLAARYNSVNVARLLIDRGADIEAQDDKGWTPQMVAASENSSDVVSLLMENGADPMDAIIGWMEEAGHTEYSPSSVSRNVEEPDLDGWNLHRAAKENRVDIADALIARGDDVNTLIPVSIGRINLLIDNGTDVDTMRKSTPLHETVNVNSLDVARLLIEHGADVDARDGSNLTPLCRATGRHSIDVARLLIESGADVNASTPLRNAASRNSLDLACLLIESGADVNASTPLNSAALENSLEVARLLIEHGAEVNAGGKYTDNTPLHWAAETNSFEVARLLVEHGADIDERNKAGDTPLHVSAGNWVSLISPKMAKLLIECGADIDARNKEGATPLQKAASPVQILEMARLLIEHGANTEGIDLSWMSEQKDA